MGQAGEGNPILRLLDLKAPSVFNYIDDDVLYSEREREREREREMRERDSKMKKREREREREEERKRERINTRKSIGE